MEDEKELDLVNSLMSIVVELLWSSRCPDPDTDEPDLQSPDPAESGLLANEIGKNNSEVLLSSFTPKPGTEPRRHKNPFYVWLQENLDVNGFKKGP